MIILLAGVLNALVIQDVVFLGVYNLVVVVATFLFGKRKGMLSAVLCVLVVVLLALFNPQLFRGFPEQRSFLYAWVALSAWAGILLLTASLIGALHEREKRAFQELRSTYYGLLEILSTFISRDPYTQHHSYRVSVYALKIGKWLGLDADRLEDWHGRNPSPPHQAEQGGRTGRDPQASGEPGPCLPAYGHADRPENRDEPVGFAGVCCHELWEALGEDTARAGGIPAGESPHGQLDANRVRLLRKVRQVALITTMDER